MSEQAPGLSEILGHFTFDVPWIIALVAASVWFTVAFRRAERLETISRHRRWKFWCYQAGVAVIAIAVLSPLEYYGNQLLWVNFTDFLLLTMVGPPLMLLGSPLTLAFRVSGPNKRAALRTFYRSIPMRVLTFPITSALLFAAATYIWQFSSLTELAARNWFIRDVQLWTQLLVAFIFWLPALATDPLRWRMPHPLRVLYIAEEMVHKGLFGAMFLGLSKPFHGEFAENLPAWGPSAMEDQRLAILILWIGGNLIFLGVLFTVVAQWMSYENRNSHRVDMRLAAERAAKRKREAAMEQVFTKPI